MLRMDTNRRAVMMLAVVVALSLGSPLAAAGWEMPRWASSGDFLKGFTHVLSWLGVTVAAESTPTCDRGSSIDPNGCPKALNGERGSSIDPNGAPRAVSSTGPIIDGGMGIDPNGLR
jgi:hypothetical protein